MKVALTCYRRPDYLRQALTSWADAGLTDADLAIFMEPTDTAITAVNLRVINETFPLAKLVHNDTVLGPLRNPFKALSTLFDAGADFVILAEDDSIVAPDVLDYFRFCASEFANDHTVLAACAFQHENPATYDQFAVAKVPWFSPTIWGTWHDRWTTYIRDTWDHDYSSGEGHTGGWDWNIRLRIMPQLQMQCVFPRWSRSQHIGRLGGSHCLPENYEESRSPYFVGDLALESKSFHL